MKNSKKKSQPSPPSKRPASLADARRELERRLLMQELARRDFAQFVMYTMPGYQMGWVHQEICRELDAFLLGAERGESPRLMLTMPPRHGKSELATRRLPAYAFGRNPNLSFISTSYSADLASRMNRDVQRIIDNAAYAELFPDTALYGKNIRTVASGAYQRNSDIFEIVGHNGSYRSAGVGGGITGMGGDILQIDDPFKDRAEADSPTIRQKVWDWYTSTLYTRLAPGGGILLIQTRWHMDDLAGRLLEAARAGEGDQWRCVNFAAIADIDEEFRKAGEALHPERYPTHRLLRIKAALGSRDWEALYQQKPVPDGGAVFKEDWLKFWLPKTLPATFDRLLLSWDMAFKDTKTSDFVVGQVWGQSGANCYLLDQVRERLGFSATVQTFAQQARKWPRAFEKLVEDKANGPAVIDTLKNKISGIIAIEPDGGKVARAHAITPMFEAGNVYLPDPSLFGWVKGYIAELLQFPAGVNDDQVDATTQALNRLRGKNSFLKARGWRLLARHGLVKPRRLARGI